ncbi:MAG: carbohydrate ABC transporter substrate-binding protein [Chloroflexota bacterium]|nr:MAG: carbohydrate ABC transporter substrate-binding protein [Chloroflexota bacterium]
MLLTFVSAMIVLALLLAACGGDEEAETETEDISGQTVTILTAAGEEQIAKFKESMAPFEERTGVTVEIEGSGDFETLALVRAEAGDPPDVYNFPQPGLMADFAREGFLIDVGQFLEDDYMQEQYNQAWIDLGTVDDTLVGVWHNADVKSLVWYAKDDFEAAGYEVPETWDDLVALTDQIVADGGIPWCVAIESSGATGWVGTDWVEDIMLRTAGAEKYDQWVAGELPFNSPEVRSAFETMGDIWLNPDYVLGGTTGILTTPFGDGPLPLFDDPPGCYLHRQASFILNFFPEGSVIGEDVDYFYLPPINEADHGKPVLGSGSILSMGKDTPAGRATMEFLTTGESTKAEVEAGIFVAPHNDVPLDWYPDDALRGFAEILQGADTFRFDGGDLMPGAVGTGTFWTGIVDYVSGTDLDTVLTTIDDSWPSE